MALESLPKIAPALFSAEQDLIQIYNKKSDTVGTINASYIGGSTPPSGSAGAIQFSDGSAFSSDSNLFWDNVNKRLGIGTNAPISKMHIAGLSTFVGASGNILGSTTANAAAQFYQTGFNGVLAIGGYSNGGGEIQTYQGGGNSATGSLFLQRQSGNVLIGSASDTAKLSIKGSGSTSATSSLLVQNSAGSSALTVKDDLSVLISAGGIFGFGDTTNYAKKSGAIDGVEIAGYGGVGLGAFGGINTFVVHSGSASLGATTANASAIFDITSTTKGFLPPRMTTTQINAIASPAEGLVAYNTTISHLCCYQSGSWVKLNHSPM